MRKIRKKMRQENWTFFWVRLFLFFSLIKLIVCHVIYNHANWNGSRKVFLSIYDNKLERKKYFASYLSLLDFMIKSQDLNTILRNKCLSYHSLAWASSRWGNSDERKRKILTNYSVRIHLMMIMMIVRRLSTPKWAIP